MKSIIILAFVAPLALCAVPHDFSSEFGLNELHQIYELKAITEEYTRLNKRYENPYAASLKVSDDDVALMFYRQGDTEPTRISTDDIGNIASLIPFDTSLRTVVVIHGWNNNHLSPMCTGIRDGILAEEDVNMFIVDWDRIANELYMIAQPQVADVGKILGKIIKNLSDTLDYSLDNFTLIGHSLGAHVAGFAGKQTKSKIGTIVGLDPAGPLFLSIFRDSRLDAEDAKYVEVIHTDASLLGANYNLGDVDFWPNGGFTQPGCGLDPTGTCSHGRSYLYMAESLSSSGTKFIGTECSTYTLYNVGACDDNTKAIMGGLRPDPSIKGEYYLNTNSESPYAQEK